MAVQTSIARSESWHFGEPQASFIRSTTQRKEKNSGNQTPTYETSELRHFGESQESLIRSKTQRKGKKNSKEGNKREKEGIYKKKKYIGNQTQHTKQVNHDILKTHEKES